jgi:hypothetical protein
MGDNIIDLAPLQKPPPLLRQRSIPEKVQGYFQKNFLQPSKSGEMIVDEASATALLSTVIESERHIGLFINMT